MVNKPSVWVSVGLPLVRLGDSDRFFLHRICGKVSVLPSERDAMWVSLVSVFSDIHLQAPVTKKGRFALEDVPMGEYLLLVIKNGTVLHIRRFQIDPALEERFRDLTIDVGDNQLKYLFP